MLGITLGISERAVISPKRELTAEVVRLAQVLPKDDPLVKTFEEKFREVFSDPRGQTRVANDFVGWLLHPKNPESARRMQKASGRDPSTFSTEDVVALQQGGIKTVPTKPDSRFEVSRTSSRSGVLRSDAICSTSEQELLIRALRTGGDFKRALASAQRFVHDYDPSITSPHYAQDCIRVAIRAIHENHKLLGRNGKVDGPIASMSPSEIAATTTRTQVIAGLITADRTGDTSLVGPAIRDLPNNPAAALREIAKAQGKSAGFTPKREVITVRETSPPTASANPSDAGIAL